MSRQTDLPSPLRSSRSVPVRIVPILLGVLLGGKLTSAQGTAAHLGVEPGATRAVAEPASPRPSLSVPTSQARTSDRSSSAPWPTRDVAVGWVYMIVKNPGVSLRVPLGWNLSSSLPLAGRVGIVVEVNGSYRDDVFGVEGRRLMEHGVAGGPRLALRRSALVAPYAQVLVGYVKSDVTFDGLRHSSGDLSIQPAAGVNLGSGRVSGRFEGSWRKLSDAGRTDEFRFVAGLALRVARQGDPSELTALWPSDTSSRKR